MRDRYLWGLAMVPASVYKLTRNDPVFGVATSLNILNQNGVSFFALKARKG